MFTHEQAGKFLDRVCNEYWQVAKTDRIHDFYAPACIGHYQHEDFDCAAIADRHRNLHTISMGFQMRIVDYFMIDDLLTFVAKQQWLLVPDKQLCRHTVVGTYRIEHEKIIELWLMTCDPIYTYVQNADELRDTFGNFSTDSQNKKAFMQQVKSIADQLGIDLSTRELDCLYYYLKGLSTKEIAKQIDISHRTVETYLGHIKQKTKSSTRGDLRRVFLPYGPVV